MLILNSHSKGKINMNKYDIRLTDKDQLSLHIKFDSDEISPPLNVSKKLSYLKEKIQSHRNISDVDKPATYVIINYNKEELFAQSFMPGERGKTSKPYFKEKIKPLVNYKTVYLYKGSDVLTEEEREKEIYLTCCETICDENGRIITNLKFLKYLSDYVYYDRVPLTSYRRLLVEIATYFPSTKEEFLGLSGAGEHIYEIFGKDIVELIRDKYTFR
jgi:hypothetical protein